MSKKNTVLLDVKNVTEIIGIKDSDVYDAIKKDNLKYEEKGKRGVSYKFTPKQVKDLIQNTTDIDSSLKANILKRVDEYCNEEKNKQ